MLTILSTTLFRANRRHSEHIQLHPRRKRLMHWCLKQQLNQRGSKKLNLTQSSRKDKPDILLRNKKDLVQNQSILLIMLKLQEDYQHKTRKKQIKLCGKVHLARFQDGKSIAVIRKLKMINLKKMRRLKIKKVMGSRVLILKNN